MWLGSGFGQGNCISGLSRPAHGKSAIPTELSRPTDDVNMCLKGDERAWIWISCLRMATSVRFVQVQSVMKFLANSMEQRPSWRAFRSSATPRNSPHFMEPKRSLPHSQEPATCSYPEADWSSPRPQSHFSEIHFNIHFPSKPLSSQSSSSLRFFD